VESCGLSDQAQSDTLLSLTLRGFTCLAWSVPVKSRVERENVCEGLMGRAL